MHGESEKERDRKQWRERMIERGGEKKKIKQFHMHCTCINSLILKMQNYVTAYDLETDETRANINPVNRGVHMPVI